MIVLVFRCDSIDWFRISVFRGRACIYVHTISLLSLTGGYSGYTIRRGHRLMEFRLHFGRVIHGISTIPRRERNRANSVYYGNSGRTSEKVFASSFAKKRIFRYA